MSYLSRNGQPTAARDGIIAGVPEAGLTKINVPGSGHPGGGVDVEGGGRPQSWRAAIRAALPVWLTIYLVTSLVTVLARVNPSPTSTVSQLAEQSWFRLDAKLFAAIAEHGYAPPADPALRALFPLYPVLLRGVDTVLPGGAFAAGLVVSGAALLAMLAILHQLAITEFGETTAGWAIWAVAAFPTAFFLLIGYNESLFLALMLASVYAMRRGNWWAAGALGGLASLTRSAGILLTAAFAYEYLRQHRWRPRRARIDGLAILLIPAGTGLFAAYLWHTFGDPLAFTHVQSIWARHLDWPWVDPVNAGRLIVHGLPHLHRLTLYAALNLAMVLFSAALLVLAVTGRWRLRRDQFVYVLIGAAFLLFAISFPVDPSVKPYPLYSVARLVIEAFPIFFILARARPIRLPYAYLGMGTQGVLLAHFVLGGWVA